jgi:hypothetical protein
MASENLRAVQATTNRFASVAGFTPLVTDGGMGNLTANAVFKAVGWAGGSQSKGSASDKETARNLVLKIVSSSGAIDHTAIMQNLAPINTMLTRVADASGLPKASTTLVATTSASGGGGFVPPPIQATTGIFDKIKVAPVWQKAAGGIAIIGLIMWFMDRKKPGAKPAGTAGRR